MSEAPKSRSTKKKQSIASKTITPQSQSSPETALRAGDLNTEAVKELFLRSEHVEWSPFCGSMKWNPNATRLKYPVASWVQEKKELLASIQAEEIGDAIFRHKPKWHKDVLKVLTAAPALVEQIENIFKFRVNQITRLINNDIQRKQQALLNNGNQNFDEIAESEFYAKVKMSDIESMARTTLTIVEAMQRAVMISNWSVNVAEEFSRPEAIMNETKSQGLMVEVIGKKKVTSADLQRWAKKYYDPPQLPAIDELNEEPKDVG